MKLSKDHRGFIVYFALFLLISLLLSPLRGVRNEILGINGFALYSLVASILFYFLALYVLKKNNSSLLLLLAMILGSSLELPFIIYSFSETSGAHPNLYIKYLSILMAYFTLNINTHFIRYLISAIYLLFVITFSYYGYERYIHYLKYGSITGKQDITIDSARYEVNLKNDRGQEVLLTDLIDDEKILLLDFWASSCGLCIQKLPEVQRFHNELKGDSNVVFHSVFCIDENRGEGPQRAFDLLKLKQCSLPLLFVDIRGQLLKDLNISRFPCFIGLNSRGNVVFRGDLNYAKEFFKR